jgi:hypothetical protein
MKKIAFLLFIVCTLNASCSTKDAKLEQNTALIEKYVQAVENLEFETMNDLLDESYIGIGPSYGDSIYKEDVVKNWKFNVENIYKSIDYTKSRNIAVLVPDGENKGEWVSNWAELKIVYKNNQQATIWANTIYQVKNNKIVKSISFYNEADVLNQLGYTFVKEN